MDSSFLTSQLSFNFCEEEIESRASSISHVVEAIEHRDWDFPYSISGKGIHSLHPYPAKFIAEIPRALITDIGVPEGTAVLDTFCGSGTTLVEAQLLGSPAVGIDLNPIACMISRVKTTPLPDNFMKRVQLCVSDSLATMENGGPSQTVSIPNVSHWFEPKIQSILNCLVHQISMENDRIVSDALKLGLSSILVRVSNQDSDTRYAAVNKKIEPMNVLDLFLASCRRISENVPQENSCLNPVRVIQKNILECTPSDVATPIGLVITSPPYPNAYEYWLYHKYRMWWLGHDPLRVKEHEIGARAHFFKKNCHTAKDFCQQMSDTMRLMTSVLIPGGFICIVIGRSRIHGEEIDNSRIIRDIAASFSLELVVQKDRTIAQSRKSFNLHHARIKTESLLVFRHKKVLLGINPSGHSIILKYNDYNYFPYEKELALREVKEILKPKEIALESGHVEIRGEIDLTKVKRLVYFDSAWLGKHRYVSLQSQLERSENEGSGNARRKQSTRYSVHGLHEYNGKFNPQIVRGILNILGVPLTGAVVDPFCGSGTTLVECAHIGMPALGIDRNPLAVYITNAKLLALATHASILGQQFEEIAHNFEHICHSDSKIDDHSTTFNYLERWFDILVIRQIENLRNIIENLGSNYSSIFLTLASNFLRDYSFQDPGDLRTRRRKHPTPTLPFIDAYKGHVQSFLNKLKAVQNILGVAARKSYAVTGDSRNIQRTDSEPDLSAKFDAAVTSPPYATALPYVDTQRLSLVWLRLCQPEDLSQLDANLVGSREIKGKNARREMVDTFLDNLCGLPQENYFYCKKLFDALSPTDGFRKKAVPWLLYRYFSDMQDVLRNLQKLVKSSGHFALVVGRNKTVLGGKTFLIDTPGLLASLATNNGWSISERMTLQAYHRYGLHQRNSVDQEELVVLRKK